MFQEFALARRIGRQAAARFRQAVANAKGPDTREKFFSRVCNAVFDEFEADQINSPEGIGPILQEHLGFERGR
jgi:hypothetical protein